jgi:hypothetical protein
LRGLRRGILDLDRESIEGAIGMEIGKPKRIYRVEPVRDPVPARRPAEPAPPPAKPEPVRTR